MVFKTFRPFFPTIEKTASFYAPYDEEIITLRNNIKKSAQAKVANGTLTVTEMLREVTAENIAMQDKILHEIQLLSAIYELKYTTNQYENK